MIHAITQQERDALALRLLGQVTPMLQQYARSAKLNFDDLYQDACEKILTILDERWGCVGHLQPYVMKSIKNLVLDTIVYTKRHRTVSLDEPLIEDASLTLADLLPSPYCVEPLTIVLARERLEDLRSSVSDGPMHHKTRRLAVDLHDTALAAVLYDDVHVAS